MTQLKSEASSSHVRANSKTARENTQAMESKTEGDVMKVEQEEETKYINFWKDVSEIFQ